MEHTQGPWKAEFYECGEDPEDNGWLICHPRTECPDTVVCKVDGEGLNNAANAELIARAPELLEENEALKARIAELEAAQEWQPIENVPFNKPVILLDAKTWAVASSVEVNRGHRIVVDAEHMQATHFMEMPKMEDEQ